MEARDGVEAGVVEVGDAGAADDGDVHLVWRGLVGELDG